MSRESEAHQQALQGEERVAGDAFLRHAGRGFLISMYAALRSLKLYPIENATAQKALDDVQAAAISLLESQGEIELRISGDFIFVNGTRLRLELDNYAAFSNILAALRSVDLGELKVQTGVERREWQIFLGVRSGTRSCCSISVKSSRSPGSATSTSSPRWSRRQRSPRRNRRGRLPSGPTPTAWRSPRT
jgi:hypothetical protein